VIDQYRPLRPVSLPAGDAGIRDASMHRLTSFALSCSLHLISARIYRAFSEASYLGACSGVVQRLAGSLKFISAALCA
jgi:hypothetical protein